MNAPLGILVNTILSTYFLNSRCILFYKSKEHILEISNTMPMVIVDEENENKWNLTFRNYGCQGILIFSKNPRSIFEELEFQMKIHMDRFNERRYLFVPIKTTLQNVMDVFMSNALQYVLDLLIIKEESYRKITTHFNRNDEEASYSLFTHKFIGAKPNAIQKLSTWFFNNLSFVPNVNLYPEKINNQMGKNIRVVSFNYRPYNIPVENNTCDSDGIEMQIAFLYAKLHNVTLSIKVDDEGTWGTIYQNWTGNGVTGNLAQDFADFGIGGLYPWDHEFNFLDQSKSYIRAGVTLLVPPPWLAPGWMVPYFSYSNTMWIVVLLSFVASILSAYFSELLAKKLNRVSKKRIDKKELFQKSSLLVTGTFLQQALPRISLPKNRSVKAVFGCIFLLALLVSSSYSSGLASCMTIPRFFGIIRTIKDLANSGLAWGATSDAWITTIVNVTDPDYVTIRNRFIRSSDEGKLKKLASQRVAIPLERFAGGFYAVENYVEYKHVMHMKLLHDDLYWGHVIMMLRKSSVYLSSVDSLIMKINQAGLVQNIAFSVVSKHSDSQVQKAIRYSHSQIEKVQTTLTWKHVEGAFGLLTVGLLTSLVVFLCELFHGRKK